jgi:putative DNA primase/helicase
VKALSSDELRRMAALFHREAPQRGAGAPDPATATPAHAAGTIPEGSRNDSLTRIAGGLRARGLDGPQIFEQLLIENDRRCDPPLEQDEVKRIAYGMERYPVRSPVTELGIARRTWETVRGTLRHSSALGWTAWQGTRWGPSDNLALQAVKAEIDKASVEAASISDERARSKAIAAATRMQKNSAINGALAAMRSEPGVEIDPAAFDADPALLNTPSGVVDLRTGQVLPHTPDLLLSKQTAAPYDPNAPCPTWGRFLHEIFQDDELAISYIQRALGYALTGETTEPCFFLPHGAGANGKSTLFNTVREMLGDYGVQLDPKALTGRSKHAEAEIARIDRARLIVAAETGNDNRLDAPLVKTLTGGEPINAKRLYKDPYSFVPVGTLFLSTNLLPTVAGGDRAIWRRMVPIPFRRVFRDDEQDKDLPRKLRAEWPGILRWLVEGAVKYYANGLEELPPSFAEDVEQYREAMDTVGAFIDSACTLDPVARAPARDLYQRYRLFCANEALEPKSQTAFGIDLGNSGYPFKKSNGRKVRLGLALKPHALAVAA